MLKGCQREMIVLQTQDSDVFEHAYLILRREKPPVARNDMLAEANRILGASGARIPRRKWRRVGLFWGGFLLGAGLFLLLHLILAF